MNIHCIGFASEVRLHIDAPAQEHTASLTEPQVSASLETEASLTRFTYLPGLWTSLPKTATKTPQPVHGSLDEFHRHYALRNLHRWKPCAISRIKLWQRRRKEAMNPHGPIVAPNFPNPKFQNLQTGIRTPSLKPERPRRRWPPSSGSGG